MIAKICLVGAGKGDFGAAPDSRRSVRRVGFLACGVFTTMVFGAGAPNTFTGVITDTMCGAKPHSLMLKDKTDAECIRICVHGPNGYALFDGTTVMKLSDQKAPEKFAGQKVRVTGVFDEKSKVLKVVSLAADGN